jgi:hypothetical protein
MDEMERAVMAAEWQRSRQASEATGRLKTSSHRRSEHRGSIGI